MTADPDVEIVARMISECTEHPGWEARDISCRILSALRERGWVKIKPMTSEEIGELYRQQFALGFASQTEAGDA